MGSHYKKDITMIDKVQQRAAHFTCRDYSRESSVSQMLKELGWQDLAERRKEARLALFYKIVNGLVAIKIF